MDNPRLDKLTRQRLDTVVGRNRDAYDVVESWMNLYIGEIPIDFDEAEVVVHRLLNLTDRMPRQTRCDERQVELQQFSTMLAQVFVVGEE